MKYLTPRFLSFLIFATCTFSVSAQEKQFPVTLKQSDVPSIVVENFHTLFPDSKEIDWSKLGDEFHAETKMDGLGISVAMDSKGNIYDMEREIKPSDLPKNIADIVAAKYPGYAPENFFKYRSSRQEFYELYIIWNKKKIEVNIDMNGNIIK